MRDRRSDGRGRSVWLMYHDVTDTDGRNGRGQADNYAISRVRLDEHLQVLASSGRRVLSAADWLAGARDDAVVLTFDDGWRGSVQHGVAAMAEHGLSATLFVTRDYIGQEGFATADELGAAAESGLDLGVHGCTHRLFGTLSRDEIQWELGACREFLASELGVDARVASAPGGSWEREMAPLARAVGLEAVATSFPRVNEPAQDLFDLGRIAIRAHTEPADVAGYCAFRLGRQLARYRALDAVRRTIGPRAYALARRRGLAVQRRLGRRP